MDEKKHPFQEIGQALRALRKKRRLTQQEVADNLGINKAAVSRLERPKANPTTQSLGNYLMAIDGTAQELLDALLELRGEKPEPEPRQEEIQPTATRQDREDSPELSPFLRQFRQEYNLDKNRDHDAEQRDKEHLLNYYRHEFVNLHERLAVLEARLDEMAGTASTRYDRR